MVYKNYRTIATTDRVSSLKQSASGLGLVGVCLRGGREGGGEAVNSVQLPLRPLFFTGAVAIRDSKCSESNMSESSSVNTEPAPAISTPALLSTIPTVQFTLLHYKIELKNYYS